MGTIIRAPSHGLPHMGFITWAASHGHRHMGSVTRAASHVQHHMRIIICNSQLDHGWVQEYLSSKDVSEARHCLRKLAVPFFHHEVVKQALLRCMEEEEEEESTIGDSLVHLLKELVSTGDISHSQMARVSPSCCALWSCTVWAQSTSGICRQIHAHYRYVLTADTLPMQTYHAYRYIFTARYTNLYRYIILQIHPHCRYITPTDLPLQIYHHYRYILTAETSPTDISSLQVHLMPEDKCPLQIYHPYRYILTAATTSELTDDSSLQL